MPKRHTSLFSIQYSKERRVKNKKEKGKKLLASNKAKIAYPNKGTIVVNQKNQSYKSSFLFLFSFSLLFLSIA